MRARAGDAAKVLCADLVAAAALAPAAVAAELVIDADLLLVLAALAPA
jgi:hypothetical protein